MKNHLKLIALFLPQFHPIPENDEWWGKDFTEWTNTKPALPLFEGHYQPHEPHEDIGYYDLSDVNVMIRQAKMAKEYGLHGFCYYYYWFNGRTLLEKPLKNMLKTPEVDIPFCLCWANHNWTRSWDTGNKEVLLEQTYDERTNTRFIDDLSCYFEDDRYIRIENKPVLLVYNIEEIPSPRKTVEEWRTYAQKKYGYDLYIVIVQQAGRYNPYEYSAQSAVEFTPNFISGQSLCDKTECPTLASDTQAIFYSYDKNIKLYMTRPIEPYPLFRCVFPMFDNTARRKKKSPWMFLGATPEKFKSFLFGMAKRSIQELPEDRQFLFINAWNEWAEGAHLEPDKKFEYQLLEICKELKGITREKLIEYDIPQEISSGGIPVANSSKVTHYKGYLFDMIKIFEIKQYSSGKKKFKFLGITLLTLRPKTR